MFLLLKRGRAKKILFPLSVLLSYLSTRVKKDSGNEDMVTIPHNG